MDPTKHGNELFAFLPYLKIRQRTRLRGIEWRAAGDVEGLPTDAATHLRTLREMFVVDDTFDATQIVCTYIPVPADRESRARIAFQIREAQLLISFIYTGPHFGRSVLPFEQSTLFLFQRGDVPADLARERPRDKAPAEEPAKAPKQPTEQPAQPADPRAFLLPGYEGVRNWAAHLWVAEGSRIYPELPHLRMNIAQQLCSDVNHFLSLPHNWPLFYLFQDLLQDAPATRQRLFVALEWYARSCRRTISPEEAILDIATALETLLRIPEGKEQTQRFKETVATLLGPVDRLDSWLDQFYGARSKTVHEGLPPSLVFYAVDKWSPSQALKDKESLLPHRSLFEDGLRIFRLCLTGILSSIMHARSVGLASLFTHNRERVESICKALSRTDSTPADRLRNISDDVRNLNEYSTNPLEPNVELDSVLSAARRIVQTYQEASPSLQPEEKSVISAILARSAGTAVAELDQFAKLASLLQEQKQTPQGQPESAPTVIAFLLYATGSGFRLRSHLDQA